MSNFLIIYDEPQEAFWFKSLNKIFEDAPIQSIGEASENPDVQDVLKYDRPDIILLYRGKPVLVIEETVEVPSGHNVGQRFPRLVAAAEHNVPVIYFGPYVARKHGGDTEGPRYMNLRLFYALENLSQVTGTAVATINWPVDEHCEIRKDRDKDNEIKEYINEFIFALFNYPTRINEYLLNSSIYKRLEQEKIDFIKTLKRASDYDNPPKSLQIMSSNDFFYKYAITPAFFPNVSEVVIYQVGSTYLRSDPYTGMAMLYHYLYIELHPNRSLILHFPHITIDSWRAVNPLNKTKKLFKHSADAILFADGFLKKQEL
ncbi:hypothetical protein ACG90B_19785 [Acinetobacter baumannii]|uniref:hypothetical protein n=1 Tax=Acinetobacter baumannii TaxID=470 RepID=UPI003891FA4B